MKDLSYVLENFFTHKDFLVAPELIPGTLGTPLHLVFETITILLIVTGSVWLARRKHLIKPVLAVLWVNLLVLEAAIIYWESTTGIHKGLDLQYGLSLYPCSIFMYAMPFALWGKGNAKKAACGYVCTLGLLGALVNFLYPFTRLADYSCLSFPAFHTFIYHGTMLFTCIVMLRSGYHRYSDMVCWSDLLLPCVPSLIVSVPANMLNYSPIHADYMYFTGQFPLLKVLMPGLEPVTITAILYVLYIFVPAMFYLPAFLRMRRQEQRELYDSVLEGAMLKRI